MGDLSRTVAACRRHRMRLASAGRWTAPVLATLALGVPAHAQGAGWSVRLEPVYLRPYGHDQHVLTIHELDLAPSLDQKTAVTLDTRSGLAYRGAVGYTRGRWTWGLQFFYFDTSQETPSLTLSANGSADQVALEVADQVFTSSNPGEVAFYRVLEDTDVALWTFDLYGERTLAQSEGGRLALRLGLRFGDFDNDYHAVVGIENTSGARLDASSNYRRMTGPMIGFAGTIRMGRLSFEGSIDQSLLMGEVDFIGMSRQFTGAFSESPAYFATEAFGTGEKIAIPVTELGIRGLVSLADWISVGVGVQAASWWDVGVPPGVVPIPGGDQVLHENTLAFFGLLGALEIKF